METLHQSRKVKILAMYLPQFHQITENDEFWGHGFTDWVTVKKAKPLFEGHLQPRVPLGKNYYDLSIKENVAWQAKLAKEYGIYGFGIYHYWFNNEKNLLTKPAQIILEDKGIDINFFFAWDNTSWKRSWSGLKGGNAWAPIMENKSQDKKGASILIPYILGGKKDWGNHYNYLRSFFLDERYVKIGGRPLFNILHYNSNIAEMCTYWDELAKQDGFEGLFFIFRYDKKENIPSSEFQYKYEPIFSGWTNHNLVDRIINKIYRYRFLRVISYDKIWKSILKRAIKMNQPNIYHGAFVSYDDTPRRGKTGGIVVKSSSPSKFEKYLSELVNISAKQGKEFVFLTAWNEWGEGACLEPDEVYNFAYLEAVKNVILRC